MKISFFTGPIYFIAQQLPSFPVERGSFFLLCFFVLWSSRGGVLRKFEIPL
jgi:hypothetical protein